jgi:hypothetical protein
MKKELNGKKLAWLELPNKNSQNGERKIFTFPIGGLLLSFSSIYLIFYYICLQKLETH